MICLAKEATMTFAHKAARFCCAAIFAPLLLLVAEAEAAPEAAPIPATRTAPVENTPIQQLSMEFRHPVADGTLMRMICLIDTPAKNALSAEELAARGIDGEHFITCLGEFVGKEYADGRFQDIAEHYVPWTDAREADFRAMLDAHNLAAENDYGARAETVTNPAYNIVIAYHSGRSLHITSEGQTLNEHEKGVEDAILTWADDAFAGKK